MLRGYWQKLVDGVSAKEEVSELELTELPAELPWTLKVGELSKQVDCMVEELLEQGFKEDMLALVLEGCASRLIQRKHARKRAATSPFCTLCKTE